MCGIATVSIGRRARKQIPYPRLRMLIKALLVELEPRGKDASGIAIINEGGDNKSYVFKKPLKPSRFVVRPQLDQVLESVNENTNFVMLHARASTSGTNNQNFNNHPIIIPDFVGIHNGTLYNHEHLFDKYDNEINQLGNVDSEVIFQLYKKYILDGELPEDAIKRTTSQLFGAFTGAVVDLHEPNRMVMFKYDRPLCLIRIPYFDIMVAISEARFFKNAIETLGLKAKTKPCEFVHDGVGIIIDVNSEKRITQEIKSFSLPVRQSARVQYERQPWVRSYNTH